MVHEKQQVQEVLTEQKIQMVTEKRHIEYVEGQENLKRNSTEMVRENQQLQQVFKEQRKTNIQGQNNSTAKSDHLEESTFPSNISETDYFSYDGKIYRHFGTQTNRHKCRCQYCDDIK